MLATATAKEAGDCFRFKTETGKHFRKANTHPCPALAASQMFAAQRENFL
jgi:hypothetical protein